MDPKISASLILCRESSNNGFEILMIRRSLKVSFSGIYIFPGGSLEESDSSII